MENKRATRRALQRKMKIRRVVTAAAILVVVVFATIAGTLAWLTDNTKDVVNTFTPSTIQIDLTETKENFKMVPGNVIDKDPEVTVKAGSEASWLFVKIQETENLDSFITYAVADGWTKLDGEDGVYYRKVDATTEDTSFGVIGNKGFDGKSTFVADKVLVKETVTEEMMEALTEKTYPKLTFTAYAVQQDNISSASEAWAIASK